MRYELGHKPILVLDFDGVIHAYVTPFTSATEISDGPVDGVKEFIEKADEYFSVCIYSSRSKAPGGVDAMKSWFRKHDLPIDKVWFAYEKPPAHITLDDRCACFNGTFPHINELLNFVPWNKKGG